MVTGSNHRLTYANFTHASNCHHHNQFNAVMTLGAEDNFSAVAIALQSF